MHARKRPSASSRQDDAEKQKPRRLYEERRGILGALAQHAGTVCAAEFNHIESGLTMLMHLLWCALTYLDDHLSPFVFPWSIRFRLALACRMPVPVSSFRGSINCFAPESSLVRPGGLGRERDFARGSRRPRDRVGLASAMRWRLREPGVIIP